MKEGGGIVGGGARERCKEEPTHLAQLCPWTHQQAAASPHCMWGELSLEVTAVPWVTEGTAGPHWAQPLVELSAEGLMERRHTANWIPGFSSTSLQVVVTLKQKIKFDSNQHGGIRSVWGAAWDEKFLGAFWWKRSRRRSRSRRSTRRSDPLTFSHNVPSRRGSAHRVIELRCESTAPDYLSQVCAKLHATSSIPTDTPVPPVKEETSYWHHSLAVERHHDSFFCSSSSLFIFQRLSWKCSKHTSSASHTLHCPTGDHLMGVDVFFWATEEKRSSRNIVLLAGLIDTQSSSGCVRLV